MNRKAFSPDAVVVVRSSRMRAVFEFVDVIADSESSVLITGETGTGKELLANLIHHRSGRRAKPFVPVSCAILSETLIEAELFGHERGAFTGALRDRVGRFEMANGGTIFLDDVDDVPLSMQVKLLRVIQTRTIERLGGGQQIPVDVRIITGSKKDLKQMVADGKFREDLYYRLNVIPLSLPPLRERREDIPSLVEHFVKRYAHARSVETKPLSPSVMDAFLRYPWPGNVRELENACERMVQTCSCAHIRTGCVPSSVLFHAKGAVPDAVTPPDGGGDVAAVSLDERLQDVERSLITWALRSAGGNKSRAAELLKVKRSTLGDRIEKLGISA